jgi:hypothetical protein
VLRLGGAVEVGHAPDDEPEPSVPSVEPGNVEPPEAGGGAALGLIGKPLVERGVLADDEAVVAPLPQLVVVQLPVVAGGHAPD